MKSAQAVGLCSSCSHDTIFYLHTFNHFFPKQLCQSVKIFVNGFSFQLNLLSLAQQRDREDLCPVGRKKAKWFAIAGGTAQSGGVCLDDCLKAALSLSSHLIAGRRSFISSDRFSMTEQAQTKW